MTSLLSVARGVFVSLNPKQGLEILLCISLFIQNYEARAHIKFSSHFCQSESRLEENCVCF